MSIENKLARFMRNTGPARFFVPLGIILVVFGIIMFGINTDEYLETDGKITAVTQVEAISNEDENSEPEYDVDITYSVDGKEYNGTFSNLTGKYSIGEDIKVYYDPANPEKISNGKISPLFAFALIAVGVVVLIFGVYKTVKAFKKSKELGSIASFPSAKFEGFKNSAGVTEYYFRFDGNGLKPGYIVEDANRKVLFEGKMLKQALVGARPYEFHNYVTGKVENHEIGHIVTQTYNEEIFSAKSWFKFDGKNIWDFLHEKGIRISTNLSSKFPYIIYDVAQNGLPLARIETSSVYVHEDEEAQHKLNIPTGNMYYRFWTASYDMEILFLTIFALSETEQTVVE
ncbi:MAG: DUF3592 domain-containing protein [Clostridia bacterium]|nr:DUF3592 domain-containing protein [Clostridia bacterium]